MPTQTAKDPGSTTKRAAPISPPPEQREDIAALSRFLGGAERKGARRLAKLQIGGAKGGSAGVPSSVLDVLASAAKAMAKGEAVSVVAVAKELTTQEAADILNVSRQYLVRLIDERKLPAIARTGKHRRVRLEDVLAFKEKRDRERRAALDRLTKLSQEYGGYDELK